MAEQTVKQGWAEIYGAPSITLAEAKDLIMRFWGTARPTVLVGEAGIGKTQVMKQAAEEYRLENGIAEEDFGYIYVMMSHVDRESLTGLPYFDDENASTFCHMHHKDFVSQIDRPYGIIIFDEFNRPRDISLLNAFFAWVTERGANGLRLNDGWNLVGAVNPSTGDFIVSQVERDAAIRRRLSWFEIQFNPGEALQFMRENPSKFHPEVVKFLRENKSLIYDAASIDAGKIGASPASWEDVSQKIFINEAFPKDKALSESLLQQAIASHVGVAVAEQFMSSYERKLPTDGLPTPEDLLTKLHEQPEMLSSIKIQVDSSNVESAEEKDAASKGWILKFMDGLLRTVVQAPTEDIFKMFEIPEEDWPTDTHQKQRKAAQLCAPNLNGFAQTLSPDLFATFTSNLKEIAQEGGNNSESQLRSVEIGTALQRQPGFAKLTRKNRSIRDKT